MRRQTGRATGIAAIGIGVTLTLGVGAAAAQEYPIDPADTEVEVLPAVTERPAGAPDAAAVEVEADALAASGVDGARWGLVGLGALGLGAVTLTATRRRTSTTD